MADIKKALKSAKAALDSQDFEAAVFEARKVLIEDPSNYFGKVFLGRGLEKQDKIDEAASAYHDATRIKPDDELAWKGLCQAYEMQGSRAVGKYIAAVLGLAHVHMKKDDQDQCQTVVDKLVIFAKANGTRAEYKDALLVLLPTSPVYDFLEGRLLKPAYTYTKLADITEAEEKETISKQISERRTRLGASLTSVTATVRREVFRNSVLEDLYQNVVDWTSDDDERRLYEERILQRAYDHLCVLLPEDKVEKRDRVIKLAHDMVIIKHPFPLAWRLELEWDDEASVASRDQGVLQEYMSLFPEAGLTKALQGYWGLRYDVTQSDGEDQSTLQPPKAAQPMSTEDRLILVAEGMEDGRDSPLSHRLAASVYLQLEEYELAVETARKAQGLLSTEKAKSGLSMQDTVDTLCSELGTALVYYQSPRNHPEAQELFNSILRRKPEATSALLGLGLILEEQERFADAHAFLERASLRRPDDLQIASEAAWCSAMNGNLESGLQSLQSINDQLTTSDASTRGLRAQVAYRIGRCLWDLHPDKKSRKDRRGAYYFFISAIKLNPGLAPAYTSLGIYYQAYASDKKRSRQCFQKAFELSASEVAAAEYLARGFADDKEWDLVDLIAQRVADSAQLRPGPGSKRQGISWPYASLGVVYMNRQDYSRSVNCFQSALRISANDYHSWVGLGESYHSSGRYNAARKTLEHALNVNQGFESPEDDWFARYMLANVHRELGDFEEAMTRYKDVLTQRPSEYGVAMALLQTGVESSQHNLEIGLFAEAAADARTALLTAGEERGCIGLALNYWKAVGDACMIFGTVPAYLDQFPVDDVYIIFRDMSLDGEDPLEADNVSEPNVKSDNKVVAVVNSAICAYKAALQASSQEIHAQAVAWYNLGWAEFQASLMWDSMPETTSKRSASRFAKASVRCFKRANELEAGNADFWNALGVVTTSLNPQIAQHSLVRSVYLNERSARTWTNLGTFYLLQNDHELAHEAFARAQSTDPDYALAWLGEGLIALLFGDQKEALSHFAHAAELADSSASIIERQYVVSTFDDILQSTAHQQDDLDIVRSLFASQRSLSRTIDGTRMRHLTGLLQERLGDFDAAITSLQTVSSFFEVQYEATESFEALGLYLRSSADLGRCQLALDRYEDAAETSNTVLDLSSEGDATFATSDERQQVRLSSYLVKALAYYKIATRAHADEEHVKESIVTIRDVLEREGRRPADVVCMLAQISWAKGTRNQRSFAKEKLLDCVEQSANQIEAMLLLGAISILDEDSSTRDAVLDDLQTFRTDPKASSMQHGHIEKLLTSWTPQSKHEANDDSRISAETLSSVMLRPYQHQVWADLAEQDEDEIGASIALSNAEQTTLGNEQLDTAGLASAYATVGSIADTQRSLLLDPSSDKAWSTLETCVE
ncbi:MAG: Superkiller protein 3 [Chrysothrix sp. TS-e1954]|nr:MAG: Superkiller protein 3 [Chrysothrix sp. TS-e1954]